MPASSTPIRARFERRGGHVHVRVFVGPEGRGAKAGDLIFRDGDEWSDAQVALECGGIDVLPEELDLRLVGVDRGARAIVGELARRDPSDADSRLDQIKCALCCSTLDPLADEGPYVGRVTQHFEDCPWRAAREFAGPGETMNDDERGDG